MMENAMLYSTLRENGKPEIELSITKQKDTVELVVHDNGIGIDDKNKARVFEMFYRGHTKAQGAGLGLYLVSKSVAAMGGSVAAESEPGQYARFTVKVPTAKG
jgi:signal transduction histidine kinase